MVQIHKIHTNQFNSPIQIPETEYYIICTINGFCIKKHGSKKKIHSHKTKDIFYKASSKVNQKTKALFLSLISLSGEVLKIFSYQKDDKALILINNEQVNSVPITHKKTNGIKVKFISFDAKQEYDIDKENRLKNVKFIASMMPYIEGYHNSKPIKEEASIENVIKYWYTGIEGLFSPLNKKNYSNLQFLTSNLLDNICKYDQEILFIPLKFIHSKLKHYRIDIGNDEINFRVHVKNLHIIKIKISSSKSFSFNIKAPYQKFRVFNTKNSIKKEVVQLTSKIKIEKGSKLVLDRFT